MQNLLITSIIRYLASCISDMWITHGLKLVTVAENVCYLYVCVQQQYQLTHKYTTGMVEPL